MDNVEHFGETKQAEETSCCFTYKQGWSQLRLKSISLITRNDKDKVNFLYGTDELLLSIRHAVAVLVSFLISTNLKVNIDTSTDAILTVDIL